MRFTIIRSILIQRVYCLIYDSSIENDGEKRQMYEIRPGHFVYATEAEAKNYKEEA